MHGHVSVLRNTPWKPSRQEPAWHGQALCCAEHRPGSQHRSTATDHRPWWTNPAHAGPAAGRSAARHDADKSSCQCSRRCWPAVMPAALAASSDESQQGRPSCGQQPLPLIQPALGRCRSRGPCGSPGWPRGLLRGPRRAPGPLRGCRVLRAVARARFARPRAVVHRERLLGEVVHHECDCAEAPCVSDHDASNPFKRITQTQTSDVHICFDMDITGFPAPHSQHTQSACRKRIRACRRRGGHLHTAAPA